MLNLLRALGIAALLAFVVSPDASAREVDVNGGFAGGNVYVKGKDSGVGSTSAKAKPSPRVWKRPSNVVWVEPEKIYCWTIVGNSVDEECTQEEKDCTQALSAIGGQADINLCLADLTPEERAARAAARSTAAARAYAIDYFRSVPLPVPQPVMSAPQGIAGATHQMNLQTEREVAFTDPDTAFGQLYLYCYATYVVEWGDGTKDTYTTPGDVYPNSPIKHSWSKRGTYALSVTADWSADWSFGPASGTLSGLATQASIPAYEVGDLQAVLIR